MSREIILPEDSDWVVIDIQCLDKRTKAIIRCKCGYRGHRRLDHVLSGRSKRCRSCTGKISFEKQRAVVDNDFPHGGVGEVSRTLYRHYRERASKRGIHFDVSIGYLWSIFNGRCALTGREIKLSTKCNGGNPNWKDITASVDRLNSNIGYVQGNVQWVHKLVNKVKRDLTNEEFRLLCKEVVEYFGD